MKESSTERDRSNVLPTMLTPTPFSFTFRALSDLSLFFPSQLVRRPNASVLVSSNSRLS